MSEDFTFKKFDWKQRLIGGSLVSAFTAAGGVTGFWLAENNDAVANAFESTKTATEMGFAAGLIGGTFLCMSAWIALPEKYARKTHNFMQGTLLTAMAITGAAFVFMLHLQDKIYKNDIAAAKEMLCPDHSEELPVLCNEDMPSFIIN